MPAEKSPPPIEPLALSPEMAAAYVGLSERTIYTLLADKLITARQTPGKGRTLVDGDSLRAYYRSLPAYVAGASMPNAPHRRRAARHG
jgi:excisionase family DNA binding protein